MDNWAFVRLVRATPMALSQIAKRVSSIALALAETLYPGCSNMEKVGYKMATATAENHQDVRNRRHLGTNSVHTESGTSIAATAPTGLPYFNNSTSERPMPSPCLHSQVCQIPLAPLPITQGPNIYRDPFFPPTPSPGRGDCFHIKPSDGDSMVPPTTLNPPPFPPSPREYPVSDGKTSVCIYSSLLPTSSPEYSGPFHIERSDSDSMVHPTTSYSPQFPQSPRESHVSGGEISVYGDPFLLAPSAPERSDSFHIELSDGDLVVPPTTSNAPQSSRQGYVSDEQQSAGKSHTGYSNDDFCQPPDHSPPPAKPFDHSRNRKCSKGRSCKHRTQKWSTPRTSRRRSLLADVTSGGNRTLSSGPVNQNADHMADGRRRDVDRKGKASRSKCSNGKTETHGGPSGPRETQQVVRTASGRGRYGPSIKINTAVPSAYHRSIPWFPKS